MAKDDYYTIKSDPHDPKHFSVIIMDKDHEVQSKRYEINGSYCDCWAGQKWCRHKQILQKFQREGKVNSNEYWNHDKQKWLPPLQGGEL